MTRLNLALNPIGSAPARRTRNGTYSTAGHASALPGDSVEEIRKELSIGSSMNAPVFPLRLSEIVPSGALRYELATRQWIDIFPDRQRAFHKLAEAMRKAGRSLVPDESPVRDAGAPAVGTS